MTAGDVVDVVLVQPPMWSVDGRVNLAAAHDALAHLGRLRTRAGRG